MLFPGLAGRIGYSRALAGTYPWFWPGSSGGTKGEGPL